MTEKALKRIRMDGVQSETIKGDLLVVDDDPNTLETMKALLTQAGYDVRCAPNGELALLFAREVPPN